ncbi:MAG: Hsp70 family protein, partial [Actinomyces sp.]|nr:Hsp70 family protein [Actinomyces sp.]
LDTMAPLTQRLEDGSQELAADVAGLNVVGGGSDLPAIARQLRQTFGRRVHRSPHPGASTAIGLAIASDPDAGYTLRDQLSRGVGVFRERESGAQVSFDTLLSPQLRVSTSQSVSVSRTYRAAHNIGWFRFVEYTTTDDEGVPRGDVMPFGQIAFPFDSLLQGLGDSVPLDEVEVRRTEDGPMVREEYTVDEHGIVGVSITDLGTGYSVHRNLGDHQA